MHLTRPRDVEAPAIRAAKLCGLAAVGASLIGSAALLHVTPVFAQSAPSSPTSPATGVKAVPTPAPVSSTPLDSPRSDATKPPERHHRGGLIISKDGVVIETGATGYRHSFTSSDGRTLTVTNEDPDGPSLEEQRRWEDEARKAEAKAADVEKMINSPEFKQRIERAQARAAEAEKVVNSPEFQARISKMAARAADAEKFVNSPEFKATIAKAQATALAAQEVVNSPDFRAKLAKLQTDMAAQEARIHSLTEQFQHQLDDLQVQEEAVTRQRLGTP